jgi:hypothetical protein
VITISRPLYLLRSKLGCKKRPRAGYTAYGWDHLAAWRLSKPRERAGIAEIARNRHSLATRVCNALPKGEPAAQ